VTARDVIAQRITTLDGLLGAPDGPFSGRGGELADRLAEGWRAERRLLARILDEAGSGDITATIRLWQERTAAFLERSAEGTAAWRDRDGHLWQAADVLRILDDLTRRVATWLADDPPSAAAAGPGGLAAASEGARSPAGGDDARPGRASDDLADPGASDAEDDARALMADEADDEEDDARYVRVNDPRGGA
jgi:hypothetical protein